ncbi:hypothetical protein N431DRAFT_425311 [Stipitochalara longipes BDJ]|nr:hypothetical protein N431DRAFT_425311 [Stipitochalara longipes BDJ]
MVETQWIRCDPTQSSFYSIAPFPPRFLREQARQLRAPYPLAGGKSITGHEAAPGILSCLLVIL